MGILAEDVARVREATDIVQLISNTVALRKAGRRWQGLCPFHSEKTPSFSVNAEEGLYYCFGCRASGDAITFVRQTEGLDFAASVELLASRAGITLRYDSKGEAAQHGRRRKLTEVVAAAVEWYHERLLQHPDAGAARGYLRSRGLTGDEVRAFKVGWAPAGWDELCAGLRSVAPAEDLTETGLAVVSSRGGLIDNFRSRVLFPVFDVRGDPVGFGGRILPGSGERAGPKYKNTPESPLYAKSRLLYGLNWAKDAMVRAGEVIVCEGYTDVIGLHAAGLPQAVATCGTALTEDHVKTMRRFCDRIVLAFDADAAGSAAAERIYQWESAHQLDVYVADLPPGTDPDDLARRDPHDLGERVSEARPFLAYRIQRALGRGNMDTTEGRVRAADAALTVIDEHPSPIVRDQYLMDVADRCRLPPDRLRDEVARLRPRQGVSRGVPEGSASGPSEPSIEEQILLLRMHAPGELPAWISSRQFSSELHGRIFKLLVDGTPLVQLTEVAEGEAAAVMARLSVWEPPEHAAQVVGRFVFDAASRWIDEVTRVARTSGDAGLGRHLGEVQLVCAELRAENWLPAAAERLALLLDEELPAPEGARR
ncbi:MAG: DNA primase [bacterium]|nr:DNA primase [bacterium]